jgi:N-hydroxyarylamine O-acetyltransferase
MIHHRTMQEEYEMDRRIAVEYKRYLSLLGVSATIPDLDTLVRLVRAHVLTVPFENVSKLYYGKTGSVDAAMDLTQYLDGIERHHFGGTCYAGAFHLNQLLRELGFRAALCGADMRRPDVHLVNVVSLGGREYLVDVGYAAPFIEPMPMDVPEAYDIRRGTDRYVVLPRDAAQDAHASNSTAMRCSDTGISSIRHRGISGSLRA